MNRTDRMLTIRQREDVNDGIELSASSLGEYTMLPVAVFDLSADSLDERAHQLFRLCRLVLFCISRLLEWNDESIDIWKLLGQSSELSDEDYQTACCALGHALVSASKRFLKPLHNAPVDGHLDATLASSSKGQ
jgi:hypothetical protein